MDIEFKTEYEKVEIKILDLARSINESKGKIEQLSEQMNQMKEEMRVLMIDNAINTLKNDDFTVSISRPKSFDMALFKMTQPELAKIYVKTKTITTESDYIEKKSMDALKELHPEAYSECEVELTPRLTIKQLK